MIFDISRIVVERVEVPDDVIIAEAKEYFEKNVELNVKTREERVAYLADCIEDAAYDLVWAPAYFDNREVVYEDVTDTSRYDDGDEFDVIAAGVLRGD